MTLRSYILFALCLVGFHVATTSPVAPWNPSAFTESGLSAPVQIAPVLSATGVVWDGRALANFETGATVTLNQQYSLGASVLTTTGHGKTFLKTFNGNGTHLWGGLQSRPQIDSHLTFGMTIDQVHDSIYLYGSDNSSSLASWSKYSATGVVLDAKTLYNHIGLLGRSGIYTAVLDGDNFATVGMLGVGVNIPILTSSSAQLQFSSFKDDYNGRHFSYEITAGVTMVPNSHSSFSIGANFYPKGVPPAGTPFSSASAVGTSFGDDFVGDLRSKAFADLSFNGQIAF